MSEQPTMNELLTALKTAMLDHQKLAYDDDYIGEPGEPATAKQLKAVTLAFGTTLPPSYAQTLAVHNGWREFMGEDHLVAVDERNDEDFKDQLDDVRANLEESGFANFLVHGFVVVKGTGDNIVYIDTNKPTQGGEFEVVEYSVREGEVERHASFRAFIEGQIAVQKKLMEDERGDAE